MKTFPGVLAACAVFVLCAPNSKAQYTSTNQFSVSMSFNPTPVIGEPYYAVEESDTKQTLVDGTNIEQHSVNRKIYRDSQGRTRIESYPINVPGDADPSNPVVISIEDPVAGTVFFLDPRNHTAHEVGALPKIAPQAPPRKMAAPQSPPPRPKSDRPKVTREDLGTQMMEGLLVQGIRTTTTIPAGAQGNDRPMQIVTETWSSPDLKVTVLRMTSDPRTGVHTDRLTQISRSEPDLSLFEIPPDYTIDHPQE